MMVENFLIYAGSEKNKEKFTTKEGSNPDLKKRTKNNMKLNKLFKALKKKQSNGKTINIRNLVR